ncbi:MAG: hypothetical protein GY821_13970 [Gammaproteobacteria bacterium]|nr:hypothetical protein [Gammaproteobacteria bacterium]
MPWVFDRHTGGCKIPESKKKVIKEIIHDYGKSQAWSNEIYLRVKLKQQFCYIGTQQIDDDYIFPLCRLRYFAMDKWSLALYTYSNEAYTPSILSNNNQSGTLAEVLETCEPFIVM